MARQTINIGSAPNDGTGDALRVAFDKINDNFLEVYDDGGANITVNNPVTSTETTLDDALADLVGGGATPTLQEVTTAGANTNVNTIWESPTDPTNIYIEINTTDNQIYFWDKNIDAVNALTIMSAYGFQLSLNGGFGTGGDGFSYIGAGGEIIQQFVMANGQNINFGIRELPIFDVTKQPTYLLNPDKLTAEYVLATLDDITGGATDLAYTPSPTNGIVTSSTGTDATLPLADATDAGLLKPADFTQLSTLATDLASKVDENTAITGATKTKITYDAKGLVTAGADATKSDVGLGNVDNTSDANKPISTATQTALDLRTRELLQDFTAYTTTGVLTEQIISNQAITANDMKINSYLNFIATLDRTGTTNAPVAIYLSTTSNNIAGAVKIGTATMTSTQSLPCFKRDYSINASSVLRGILFTANAPTDEIATQAQSTTTLTLGSTYYLITTVQLNNVADTVTQRAINLKSSK